MPWSDGITHLGLWGDMIVIQPYSAEIIKDNNNQFIGYICSLTRIPRKNEYVGAAIETVTHIQNRRELRKYLEQRLSERLMLKSLSIEQ